MIADILMAFVVAVLIEMISLNSYRFKKIMVSIICLINIIIYFLNDRNIDFVGEVDYAIWILLVILFNTLLTIISDKIKQIKKNNQNN